MKFMGTGPDHLQGWSYFSSKIISGTWTGLGDSDEKWKQRNNVRNQKRSQIRKDPKTNKQTESIGKRG